MATMDTPEGIRDILDSRLLDKQTDLELYTKYYEGDHRLGYASSKFRNTFGSLFSHFSDNWCGLIVDSVEERLNIEGFRMGNSGEDADEEAWRIWQKNGLDLQSELAHREALITGSSYVTVWAGDDPNTPEINVESSQQMIVAYEPGNRRKRLAAWKRWLDDDGFIYGTLYLPNEVIKYRSASTFNRYDIGTKDFSSLSYDKVQWILRPGVEAVVPNPLGIVPVVELRNQPRILGDGRSEIESIINLQDAANKLIVDMLVAAEYSAFRQRWVTGLDIPTDSAGNPVEPFEAAVDRLWQTNNPDAKFGEFQQTDLGHYVRAIELLVQHVASQSRTPFHYFLLNGGQAPSGESIQSAEAGLISKAYRRQRSFEEGWEEAMRIAFLIKNDTERGEAYDAQVIWKDPAYRSQSALVDSLIKLDALGVPRKQLWADAGYSPQEIERFEYMLEEQREMFAVETPQEPTVAPVVAQQLPIEETEIEE